jgi:hypothetical protein
LLFGARLPDRNQEEQLPVSCDPFSGSSSGVRVAAEGTVSRRCIAVDKLSPVEFWVGIWRTEPPSSRQGG